MADRGADDDAWVEPLAELIEEIGVLTTRWRGGQGQPVVSLVGDGARSALATLSESLTVSKDRRVPHAVIDTTATGSVRELLAKAAEKLVSGPFGRGHRLRFRHFWFLDWLMSQEVPKEPARERRAELARRLRRASGPRSELPKIGSEVLAGWSGLVLLTVSTLVPSVLFRVLVSGRVPGPGRVFRWLMRQRYASMGAADFWSFALRLTADADDQPDTALMNRLLVHAFLQDLADQYRRVPWRRMPWRRTAYPVLLLGDVAPDGPGAELVRQLSVVRGKSEVVDPLLVVTAENGDTPTGAIPLTMADEALRKWRSASRIDRGSGRNDQNAPLLRVVVANAGQEMQAVDTVAAMLRELLDEDKSVVGIVGLVESRTWTKAALDLLDQEGLPLVAPTLSADGIGEGLSYYLQISPANREQARMVRDYATGVLGRGELVNYYTYGAGGKQAAESDLYVNTLRDSLEKAYAEQPGASYRERYWGGGELDEVCGGKGQYSGVVFFGGRYHDFGAFLSRLARDCSGKLPIVIGDDSVNRYMANASARAGAPDVLPMSYVSKGALAFCERLEAARADQDTERAAFLNSVRDVLDRCEGDTGEPVGERVGLAYDGVNLLLTGVRNMASRRPNSGIGRPWNPADITPGALYQEIRDQVAADGYLGVTGRITFDHEGVVVGKPLSLLCVRNVRQAFEDRDNLPTEVYRVGRDTDITPAAPAVACR